MTATRRTWTLIAVSLATFMTYLDNNIVNVAMPAIQKDLRLSTAGLEWVVSGYILAFAVGPLLGGVITDHLAWGWIFFINVPVGIATMALGAWAIRGTEPSAARIRGRIDLPGLITSAMALV